MLLESEGLLRAWIGTNNLPSSCKREFSTTFAAFFCLVSYEKVFEASSFNDILRKFSDDSPYALIRPYSRNVRKHCSGTVFFNLCKAHPVYSLIVQFSL